MAKPNPHFLNLDDQYLFDQIAARSRDFSKKNPTISLLNLGIGDVSLPIPSCIVDAMCLATQELGIKSTFQGYGPSQGIDSLRAVIAENDYANKNLPISKDEIFVGSGIKLDCAHIQTLFAKEAKIAVCDPTYPVYVESNVIAGRATNKPNSDGKYADFTYLPCREETNFSPSLPNHPTDLIYLCSPNNPTGTSMSRGELKEWVDYAISHQAVILYDGAYEAFIESDAPRSIYEIPRADECAIEFRSFSKKAGFTGLRLSYTVVPKKLSLTDHHGQPSSLHSLWSRYKETKVGGVSYPIQKGGEAAYSEEGQKQININLAQYKKQTALLHNGLKKLGLTVFGGIDSPYIWCKTPNNISSWDFFQTLLEKANIISIPGSGFGTCGEGFIRFSGFASEDVIRQALINLQKV